LASVILTPVILQPQRAGCCGGSFESARPAWALKGDHASKKKKEQHTKISNKYNFKTCY
jgi:hypothetical protein